MSNKVKSQVNELEGEIYEFALCANTDTELRIHTLIEMETKLTFLQRLNTEFCNVDY